jgi:phenylpropionate dioxygenase-like ring-hydroxylating dioxygenase large terminal subunit
MSRVCLHRWAPVVSGAGNAKLFSCPFHKWGYALDGRLLGAPFMEQAANFDPKACRLPEVRTEIVEPLGLIFITFSQTAESIGDRLGDLCERLKNWRMGELVGVQPSELDAKFNWKIQLETGMECYHPPELVRGEQERLGHLSLARAGRGSRGSLHHRPAGHPDIGRE